MNISMRVSVSGRRCQQSNGAAIWGAFKDRKQLTLPVVLVGAEICGPQVFVVSPLWLLLSPSSLLLLLLCPQLPNYCHLRICCRWCLWPHKFTATNIKCFSCCCCCWLSLLFLLFLIDYTHFRSTWMLSHLKTAKQRLLQQQRQRQLAPTAHELHFRYSEYYE